MSLKRKHLTSVLALLLTSVLSAQTTFAYSNVTLKHGMRGDDVYTLQQDLNELGFMTVEPTGYYGPITKAAVLEMQKQYGLLKDGIAGKQTLGKLDSLMGRNAVKAEADDEAAATALATETTAASETVTITTDGSAVEINTATEAGNTAETTTDTIEKTAAAVEAKGDKAEKTAAEEQKASRGKSSLTESIIAYARRFMGVKYVWGGTTTKGFDCSGFVQYVYDNFDISLSRNSVAQSKNGTYIKKADLLPGDLVFFDTNGGKNRINHVGIYIGGGKMIHSSSSHKGVVISTISSGFYAESYMTARRVLK